MLWSGRSNLFGNTQRAGWGESRCIRGGWMDPESFLQV